MLKKISHARRGLWLAISTDRGIQFQIVFAIITIPLLWLLLHPLTTTEYALMTLAYGLLFVTELQNTALEISLNRLHPEQHESIRDSKDIAASSVLMSLGVFILITLLLISDRMWL